MIDKMEYGPWYPNTLSTLRHIIQTQNSWIDEVHEHTPTKVQFTGVWNAIATVIHSS